MPTRPATLTPTDNPSADPDRLVAVTIKITQRDYDDLMMHFDADRPGRPLVPVHAITFTDDSDSAEHDAMDDAECCEEVARRMRALDYHSEAVHTGGGIWCVLVARKPWADGKQGYWLFGMAADVWGGQRHDAAGNFVEDTNIDLSTDTDAHDASTFDKTARDIDYWLRNID